MRRKGEILALVAWLLIFGAVIVNAAADQALRKAGRIVLVANTPQALGSSRAGRVELQFKNEGDNDICCGYTPAALNCGTPGPDAGFRYKSGEGIIRCVFPDIELYCVDATGGSEVSVDEAFLRTAIPATATATP